MSEPQKIPLKDIESITNNFADENLIGGGFLGKIYEGQLPDPVSGELIDVTVRRADHSFWLQDMAFEKEISILSSLKHKNMVSNVGFCDENNEMIIINKRATRGSLRMHLSGTTLDWKRRLQISIGVVRALSYLHNDLGPDHSIIHHNINSDSILLDENWEAKISGFEYSKTIPTRHLDLAFEKLGFGTYKSDVFSVGIVLFELLCGTKAFVSKDDNIFQASLAIFHYENGELHKLVDPDLSHQMDQQSFIVFSKTAYNCLINQRAPPNLKEVLKRLEKALKFQQMHENNEQSTVEVDRTVPNHLKLKLKNLEYMRIRLADILLATEKFASKYCIASGGFGSVYAAELEHVDKGYRFAIDSENKPDIPKTRSKVAIKRIIDTGDEIEERGFYAEIEMLTSCKQSNIITLLGFCNDGLAMILIYEYASNGSLNHYLFSKHRKMNNDSWTQRVKICLDAAKGLSFLHTADGDRHEIVHRDIKSANILLDENFEVKIGDFGLSVFPSLSDEHYTRSFRSIAGTPGYMDPQYRKDAKLKTQSDIYSFGVVLFEILFGTLSYDPIYTEENGLALVARQRFDKGTIMEMVDPRIRKEGTEFIFNSVRGPSQDSLDTFSRIAYACLEEAQAKRPKMEVVVKELEKALFFQERQLEHLERMKIPFIDIQMATKDFTNIPIRSGGYGDVYRAKLQVPIKNKTTGEYYRKWRSVAIKCIREDEQGKQWFNAEIELLTSCKHTNIVSLLGFCDEGSSLILIYEHESNRSLDDYLGTDSSINLTWVQRIMVGIDIAYGLNYIHTRVENERRIVHRDIKSANILLSKNWAAKIADFGLSRFLGAYQKEKSVLPRIVAGAECYVCPEYVKNGRLETAVDIYSFGVVLFELLSGKLANDPSYIEEDESGIAYVARRRYKERTLHEMVDPKIMEVDELTSTLHKGPNQETLITYLEIAHRCVAITQDGRPPAKEIIEELEKTLSLQTKMMSSHEEFAHLKFQLKRVVEATDNFAEENLIGQGGFGKVYKGNLLVAGKPTNIAARRLHYDYGQGDLEFWNEISILATLKHDNLVSFIGFCDEGGEKIIIKQHEVNGSLDIHLSSPAITWMQRLMICVDVAHALNYIHCDERQDSSVIHGNIKSSKILLDEKWKPKLSGFEHSKTNTRARRHRLLLTEVIGTIGYVDPIYEKNGFVSHKSDVYSFGVVLFEVLCGRRAFVPDEREAQYSAEQRFILQPVYTMKRLDQYVHTSNDELLLAEVAKLHYDEENLHDIIHPDLWKQMNPKSFKIFSETAYHCLNEKRVQRPDIDQILKHLEKALQLQIIHENPAEDSLVAVEDEIIAPNPREENNEDNLQISFEEIKSATNNFSRENLIGGGGFGKVFKGEVTRGNESITIVAKRLDRSQGQGEHHFLTELEILFEYKHENIIGLEGYCNENNEKIIVYEHACNGSLDKHLKDVNLTWSKRLKIGIDIARGLAFLHGGAPTKEMVIHRDIKSANILLNIDWKAKISDFGLSAIIPRHEKVVTKLVGAAVGYVDPQSELTGFFTEKSDIYSFGVLLFETVYGKLVVPNTKDYKKWATSALLEKILDEQTCGSIVFKDIKEQINPQSLSTFRVIVAECLRYNSELRPTAEQVLQQLEKSLEFQEDYEIWGPNFPQDYEKILKLSKYSGNYSNNTKHDLCDKFLNGILLQDDKVWFSLGPNDQRNELVSATTFSYRNHSPHDIWCIVPESRFQKLAKILDISNLMIKIKTRPLFLSQNTGYGVHLVFKFCDSKQVSRNRMYVDLKYQMGSETLNAYFAQWRDDKWMMIELYRFSNQQEEVDLEFLLESLSPYYSRQDDAIYVEGIEFRPIDNVGHDDIQKSKEIQQITKPISNQLDQELQCEEIVKRSENYDVEEKLFSLSEVNGMKHLMLSAMAALYNFSDSKLYKSKPSSESSFQEVLELLPQPILRINCMIKSQMLSRDTHYGCYLVFKLTEKCNGLHCPVEVRDLLQNNKAAEVVYFRPPKPWNIHDITRVPEQRKDEWMEIYIWKFNSTHQLKNDCVPVNLKLVCYEGYMSGLIVCGLEFRPM